MKRKWYRAGMVAVLSVMSAVPMVFANEFESQIKEYHDQSEHVGPAMGTALHVRGRFVPIVIPISNPTLGVGLAGGILYMHGQDEERNPEDPANMTGVFAMYTDTESWAFGGFHSGSYFEDSVRVQVPIAHGDFNLKFYGIGANSPFRDNPVDYDATGNMFIPRVSMELPIENWFVGGLYRIIDMETFFGNEDSEDDIDGYNARQKTAGFGLVGLIDTRDSNLWPRQGSWLDFTGTLNGSYAGGDFDYFKSVIKWAQYFPVHEKLTLIYRLDGQYVEGGAPFWDLARIRLRGFSSGQYLDRVATTAQAEVRWNLYKRWHASMFYGAGWIGDSVSDIGWSDPNLAGGVGCRYMLVEDRKLSVGIDAAHSRDAGEYSVYFQVGDWLAN